MTSAIGATQQSAVRYFAADHPSTPRTLRGRLEQRSSQLIGQLIDAQDWADYKQRAGHIRGLLEAIQICADTEKDLDGE